MEKKKFLKARLFTYNEAGDSVRRTKSLPFWYVDDPMCGGEGVCISLESESDGKVYQNIMIAKKELIEAIKRFK